MSSVYIENLTKREGGGIVSWKGKHKGNSDTVEDENWIDRD